VVAGGVFNSSLALIASDGGPLPRIEVFRYVTDAEAAAAEAKSGGANKDAQGTGEAKP